MYGNFVRTPPLWGFDTVTCRFGTITVQGVWIVTANDTRVMCTAPPASEGVVVLEVAPNGVQYTTSLHQFRFFVPPTLLLPVPSIGPLTGGGSWLARLQVR